jgi:NADPH:quinone reductase-like Zn-dependent oxidoreductase
MDSQAAVDEVGTAVTEFQVGERRVRHSRWGANAEYVAGERERRRSRMKPKTLTYEEAAVVPDGSLLALTCLRPAYPLQGKRVLVYGAAGTAGNRPAVQLLAKPLFGPM